MLHLKGDSEADMMNRMIREAITYYANGVDAVLVEKYFGSAHDCELALEWLYHNMPNKCYGVNILGDYKEAFRLAKEYHADFVQIDSVCGHLKSGDDEKYAAELIENEKDRTFDVLGGLRFKYQSVRSGRTLEEDAELAKLRCDAVVTTGEGTGMDTFTEKLMEFRQVLGDFPLIVGAGNHDMPLSPIETGKMQYYDFRDRLLDKNGIPIEKDPCGTYARIENVEIIGINWFYNKCWGQAMSLAPLS